MNFAADFIDFVKQSPTAFHAIDALQHTLEADGYRPLNECEGWTIVPGGKYYVTRNRSALIAFRVPESGFAPFQIVASHSDSPSFKLKPACEDEAAGHYIRLNTEKYAIAPATIPKSADMNREGPSTPKSVPAAAITAAHTAGTAEN